MSARILNFIPVMTNSLFKVYMKIYFFVLKDGLGNWHDIFQPHVTAEP